MLRQQIFPVVSDNLVVKVWDSPRDTTYQTAFWDRPVILADRAVVEASLNLPHQRASYLSASSPHSGDWLYAMPITSCGLRLDDEAVRVAVGLRLGSSHRVPRILGHSSWSTRLHLQESSEQNVQTSRTQRPGGSRLCVGGNTCSQKNLRVYPAQAANDPMG